MRSFSVEDSLQAFAWVLRDVTATVTRTPHAWYRMAHDSNQSRFRTITGERYRITITGERYRIAWRTIQINHDFARLQGGKGNPNVTQKNKKYLTLWGTFFNTACPGVYIEQNAPRAVRSKAKVWTERPARGAFYKSLTCIKTRIAAK